MQTDAGGCSESRQHSANGDDAVSTEDELLKFAQEKQVRLVA